MTLQTKSLCGFCCTYFLGVGPICPDCEKLRKVQRNIDRTATLERQWAVLTGGEK